MELNDKQLTHNHTHKPAGNYYFIHESKRHPGQKYCFNPETKDSQWIDCGAGKTTGPSSSSKPDKISLNNSNFKEKKYSSQEIMNNTNGGPPRIYNKQVINNQFPNQNFCVTPNRNNQNIYNPVNQTLSLGAVPAYNEIWAIPPASQFLLTPIINQQQLLISPSNIVRPTNFNDAPQNILNPTTSNINETNHAYLRRNINNVQANHHSSEPTINIPQYVRRKCNIKNNIDLREKLLAKKRKLQIISHSNGNNEFGTSEKIHSESKSDNDRDAFLQNSEKHLQGPQQFNLSALKGLSKSNSNTDVRYIVPDTCVILKNWKFLTNLLETDETCQYIVAESVITELYTLATHQKDVNARDIYRFLTDELKKCHRWMKDQFSNDDQKWSIFDICSMMSTQKYNVVLLSDDKKLLKLKNVTKIPIFTVGEFKESYTIKSPAFSNFNSSDGNSLQRTFKQQNNAHSSTQLSNISSEPGLEDQQQVILQLPNVNLKKTIVEEDEKIDSVKQFSCLMDSKDVILNPVNQINTHEENSTKLINIDKTAGCSSTINTNTTDNYSCKKRQIKLKQNEGVQKHLMNKKRWGIRTKNLNNCEESSNNSTSSKDNNVEQKFSGILPVGIGSKEKNSINKLRNLSCTASHVNSEPTVLQKKDEITSISTIDEIANSFQNTSIVNHDNSRKDKEVSSFDLEEQELRVMFEIKNKNMEECLIIRNDEMYSRFVQILEDVLSHVLNQEPKFTSKEYPPPWNLQEATRCIIKKFCDFYSVVDAANNLSIIICKHSDVADKYSRKINPPVFMKMYSYGVYLIKSLNTVCNNSEELQTATESLQSLLNDIQNYDVNHGNDTFIDNLQEPVEKMSVEKDLSITKRLSSENIEESHRNVEETLNRTIKPQCLPANISNLKKKSNHSTPNSAGNGEKTGNETINDDESIPKISEEPKIIRKFNVCAEFEKRLGKNFQTSSLLANYGSFEKEDGELSSSDNNDDLEKETNNDTMDILNTFNNGKENEEKFRYFIKYLVDEIKAAFVKIHTLGRDVIGTDPKQSSVKAIVKASIPIMNIKMSLESIVNREADNNFRGMHTLIKKAGLDFTHDPKLISEYTDIVATCLSVADGCLKFIDSVKTKHSDHLFDRSVAQLDTTSTVYMECSNSG